MKAVIEASNGLFIIRMYGTEGALNDVHVVEEIELRDDHGFEDRAISQGECLP